MEDNLKNLSQKQYTMMTEKQAKPSNLGRNCLFAFLIGGLICIIGQGYHDLITSNMAENVFGEVSQEAAAAHTSVFMVFLGVLLTALNVYDNIGKVAGAGSIVPITGFANSITSPAMEFRSEGHILGVGAQMFVVAGPVIVYGTAASVIAGVIYYFVTHG